VIRLAPITGCTSIDNSTNDNGFLACAFAGNPAAGSHGSTAEAIGNLIACLGGRKLATNLVGHGDAGIISTGDGQNPQNPDKYFSLGNQAYWEPYLTQLRDRVVNLSLWACHPGAGPDGASFLYKVARVINAPVAGPTGFLYCDAGNFSREAGSTWQVATPTSKPSPINPPTLHLYMDFMKEAQIRIGNSTLTVSTNRIISVRFSSMSANKSDIEYVNRNDIESLLMLINFSNPIQLPGMPAAITTGEIFLTIDNEGKLVEKHFLIYNNRLVQDQDYPLTGYYCNESIQQFLK
jgi:hypothetical protein